MEIAIKKLNPVKIVKPLFVKINVKEEQFCLDKIVKNDAKLIENEDVKPIDEVKDIESMNNIEEVKPEFKIVKNTECENPVKKIGPVKLLR